MVCLGFEPGAAGWKARANPLSYGSTPNSASFGKQNLLGKFLGQAPEPFHLVDLGSNPKLTIYPLLLNFYDAY